MVRNAITTIDNLQIGDVFYKQGDAKKTKLLLHKKDEASKKYICVDPEIEDRFRNKEFLQKWLKPGTMVIFLRQTITTTA